MLKLSVHKLVLASESPRRRQLLEQAGFVFDVVSVKVSEIPNKNLNVNAQILDIASRKARAAFTSLKSSQKQPFIVLSADTEVIFNGGPLGKPSDEQDACRLLGLLSGQTHEVKTAIFLIDSETEDEISQIETTLVVFKSLTTKEILDYIATKEPMDKAGAYAIQGLGRQFIEKFIGPYDNVVGLPVSLVEKCLQSKGWHIQKSKS
jgi:septum formation protein